MTDTAVMRPPPEVRAGSPRRPAIRVLRHEWTAVALSSLLLALAMTWPAMRHPLTTIASDTWDPSLQSWEMAWSGWAVTHHPGQLWEGNAFYTERYSYAYSDSLLGYLPASVIGSGPVAAVLRYNIVFVLAFALAFFGAYVLARQLGSRVPGAVVAGGAFAYAPWHWTQVAHLHVLSTGGVALSLAMLARGHGYSLRTGYRPERARPRWALAGWLVAAWQITIGFGVGLPFAYVLALLVLASAGYWLWRRPRFDRRLLSVDAIGMLVFAAASAAMAYPYLQMVKTYPYARRALSEILYYSPGFKGFVTAPPGDWLWGPHQQGARVSLLGQGGWEAIMLPGFTLYALGLAGLFVSVWPRSRRILLLVGLLGFGTLAMGLRAPVASFYYKAYAYLPGWDAIRTPGRLIVWVTLILGLLAAGLLTAVAERLRARPAAGRLRPLLSAALALPCLFVLVEGVQRVPFVAVPRAPSAFSTVPGPVLVLPTDWKDDELTMLWSTANFVPLVNGSSGFVPIGLARTRQVTQSFPDAASVRYLRELGVRTVLVLRHPYASQAPDAPEGSTVSPHALTGPIDGLGITREDGPDLVIYHL